MALQRWLIFIAVTAVVLTAFVLFRRWVAGRVESVIQETRAEVGIPPRAPLEGYVLPITREMAFWIDVDHFLSRFSVVIAAMAVVLSFGVVALFPRRRARRNGPSAPSANL
jgi:hypothetical protein